jgi:large subunit ribosomal protein L25
MKQFSLKVAPREGVGRGPSRRARLAGRVPAILYGKLNPPQTLSLDNVELAVLLKEIAGSAAIIEIKESEADQRLSFIQEIQRDPMTDRILHVDLHEVSANEEIELNVTVHPVGDCAGVRSESGILEIVSHVVRIRCLPKDLPAFIEVDVSELHLDESIHVSQLPKLPGVKYVDEPGRPVIACVEPVVEVEPAPAAEVPAEGAPAEGAAAEGAAAAAPGAAPAAAGAAPAAGGAAAGAAPAAAGAKPADKKAAAKK